MKNRIFFLLIVAPLFGGCSGEQPRQDAGKYRILTAEPGDLTLHADYAATLRGRQCVEIRPQVGGFITDILIDEGAAVRKGQVLFVIDQVPYRAALETAEANVKSAEARLQTARLTAESKEALFRKQVVSEFDRQTAANQLLEAEAELAQARAAETNARNNLSYTEVKSPVDGVASMIPYRVGALVDSSIDEPLVTVSDDRRIYAYFSMAESQMLDLIEQYGSLDEACAGMSDVGLRLGNGSVYGLTGRIDAISGTVDEGTGAVRIRAVFENPPTPAPQRRQRNGFGADILQEPHHHPADGHLRAAEPHLRVEGGRWQDPVGSRHRLQIQRRPQLHRRSGNRGGRRHRCRRRRTAAGRHPGIAVRRG